MASQTVYTYADTTAHRQVITDVISLIDPYDTPMIEALGGLDGAASKFRFVNNAGYKVEWLEDTLPSLSGSLGAAITSTSATSVDVATGTGVNYKPGDIILIDSEGLYVSSVSTDTLTVTRGFIGTAATHASTATVEFVGQARLEGADSDGRAVTDITSDYNYTQIMSEEVKVSGTYLAVPQYGIADELEYQSRKMVPHLMRLIEKNLFRSTRTLSTTLRSAGGLDYFITASTAYNGVSSTSVTETAIQNATEAAFLDGGQGPWIVPVSPTNQATIAGLYNNSSYLRVDRTEDTIGMNIGTYVGPFGTARFVLDRWARNDRLFFVDPQHAGLLTLRPFQTEGLAKTGDSVRQMVLTEYTFCIRQANKAHAVVFGIT